jgi:predicted AAA+ superfamily ATPase
MIPRPLYIEKIRPFIDHPVIKVISGIRRSGKSMLLLMLRDELLSRGVDISQIIYINFESFANASFSTADALYQKVINMKSDKKTYILLDEIQDVSQWEKAVNSFMVDFDCDIYITGSNSRLLSSELATLIAGRYVSINVETLSFGEYLDFAHPKCDLQESFKKFLRLGGFPGIHVINYDTDSAYKLISDIYASVILRDTIQRNNVRNIDLLNRLVRYVFENVGNYLSASNISKYFKSQHSSINIETIYNYLSYLESSFIIRRVNRYDIRGKEILKANEKYFLSDHALPYALNGYHDSNISGVLENIVYLELVRRGYQVFVGKFGTREVDFVAERRSEKIYLQVAYLLSDDSVVKREFSPLLEIDDNFPKYVVTMDSFWHDNINGVRHANIADFLLNPQW